MLMVARYRSRISGPLLDRIDMHVSVAALTYEEIASRRRCERSSVVRARVEAARAIQMSRQGTCNARLAPENLEKFCALDEEGGALLQASMKKLGLSARAHDRVLRVARTIADLAEVAPIASSHVAEAIQYRGLDRMPSS